MFSIWVQCSRPAAYNVCAFAAVSEKIKEGKAHGVEMCGEKLVLFRGKDGKVSCYPAPLLLSS